MNKFLTLGSIFLIAIALRFLYFPDNIYFGYDQARDAFTAIEILRGDLKVIGPTTAFPGLHHGVLYYYILAPLLWLGQMSPEFAAAALRIFNATGVFLIFYLAKVLFNSRVGFLSALFFAISFEESQFSIYMGNPSLGVLSMTLMYLGLALVIFKKKLFGLPLALLGFGFSVQFQFALIYLMIPFVCILLIFHKDFIATIQNDKIKIFILSVTASLLSLSTFLVAELKYNFPTLHGLINLTHSNPNKSIDTIFNTYTYTVGRMLSFNFSDDWSITLALGILFLVAFIWFFKIKEYRAKLLFIGIWFFSLSVIFFVNGGVSDLQKNVPLFYPNVGISVSLLIFAAFLLEKIYIRSKFGAIFLTSLIILANLQLIQSKNQNGTISEIDVQQGMILGMEKKVLNYIYQDANSQPFAVKAVTMPLFINTTWSYLFQWYGNSKYGYLPLWNGKNAQGFPGNLKVQEAQEGLPDKRYVIIEPTRGIATDLIDDFLREEGYFTKVIDEKTIGLFVVQKREKI